MSRDRGQAKEALKTGAVLPEQKLWARKAIRLRNEQGRPSSPARHLHGCRGERKTEKDVALGCSQGVSESVPQTIYEAVWISSHLALRSSNPTCEPQACEHHRLHHPEISPVLFIICVDKKQVSLPASLPLFFEEL